MRVSIIIPTYNEATDIRETLDAALALSYPHKEILVIDASRDETPHLVQGYAPHVRLIKQNTRGRAAARNEGLRAANGEIVIILNADVRLPANFIERILPHYANGADYVLVESRVTNTTHPIARYWQAIHQFYYPRKPETEKIINWTEGFSCRREAALAVGGIPEGGHTPLLAGEDGWFGEKLQTAGYRKVIDYTIEVTHVMPTALKEFWAQLVGRGHGTIQIWRLRDGWTTARIKRTALTLYLLGCLALLFPLPALQRGWQLAQHSTKRYADFLPFVGLSWVETLANLKGISVGVSELATL